LLTELIFPRNNSMQREMIHFVFISNLSFSFWRALKTKMWQQQNCQRLLLRKVKNIYGQYEDKANRLIQSIWVRAKNNKMETSTGGVINGGRKRKRVGEGDHRCLALGLPFCFHGQWQQWVAMNQNEWVYK